MMFFLCLYFYLLIFFLSISVELRIYILVILCNVWTDHSLRIQKYILTHHCELVTEGEREGEGQNYARLLERLCDLFTQENLSGIIIDIQPYIFVTRWFKPLIFQT